tara:strand:- start:2871 stop:3323 length:453 start_codon:yes stop_codon:yes gene_type:complete
MTVHFIHQKPLGAMQREVLMLAEHGDIGVLRGAAPQRKALIKKGMIDDVFNLTAIGAAQLRYEYELTAPRPFHSSMVADLGFHRYARSNNTARSQGYGNMHWVGTHSADGQTAYVARKFSDKPNNDSPVIAIIASTIPSEYRAFFQLKEL